MTQDDRPLFAERGTFSFFPTHVWAHDLAPEVHQALNRKLVASIETMIAPRPELGPDEIWQTDQLLHEEPAFEPLVKLIRRAVDNALEFLKVRYESYAITACWANVSPPGRGHPGHCHPNNYLSGVYYVKVARGGDNITFNDPRVQTGIFAPHVTHVDQSNAVQASLPVKEGRLLVFPAWFVHSVPPNMSQEERISISFNVMFKDFAEKMAYPVWRSRFGSKQRDPNS